MSADITYVVAVATFVSQVCLAACHLHDRRIAGFLFWLTMATAWFIFAVRRVVVQ